MQIEKIYDTIQGEGHWTGVPITLVRTYGCPVGCWFCDTGYAKSSTLPTPPVEMRPDEINPSRRHVLLTGGEPLIQPDLSDLCHQLILAGHEVQIETAGIRYDPKIPDDCWITLSPKKHVHPAMWQRADEVKFVLSPDTDLSTYEKPLSLISTKNIYWQPEFEALPDSLDTCIAATTLYGGRISIQTHKFLGIE
jgi:7-carboxy-7-deazaguanine synthase